MFILDLLDNLPWLRLSDDHLKVIIWAMNECGTPNVPSFTSLRAKQAQLTKEMEIKTTHHTSAQENIFYSNRPSEMTRLFHDTGKWVEENDTSLEHAQQMWINEEDILNQHFYIKELARMHNGQFVIPLQFVEEKEIDCFDGYEVIHYPATGIFVVHDEKLVRFRAKELQNNVIELSQAFNLCFNDICHPVRAIAAKRPAFTVRLMPWVDDQYNAHTNIYVANINLLHNKLKQEYFIRFCSTSQHASSSEQLELKQEIIFRIILHIFPADNPQQSEHCSHIGGQGNKSCRSCKIGGTVEEQDTVNQIKSQLWIAGLGVQEYVDQMQTYTGVKDKTAEYWINIIVKKLWDLQQERIFSAETRDVRLDVPHLNRDPEARQAIKATIIGEIQQELHDWLVQQPPHSYNAVLPMDAGEILHTFLLGQEKYVWHTTSSCWDKKKDELFAARLQGSSIDGLSLPPIRADYMLQYKNSLVGKHFKALQQVGVFHLYGGLCESNIIRDLWKATGELGALLWFNKICDMNTYLEDLEVLIVNILNIWALIDPNKILNKNKLHVFTHLVANIHRFGPAILYSTEVFECWNAIFRFCSVLSNHQAPSHDIVATLADMECFKHQVRGGWWCDQMGSYIHAGEYVRAFLLENPALQRRLGWVEKMVLVTGNVGTVKLESRCKWFPAQWTDTVAPLALPEPPVYNTNQNIHACVMPSSPRTFQQCKYLVARSQDICRSGSWVFFSNPNKAWNIDPSKNPSVLAGQIHCILSPDDKDDPIAVVEVFKIAGECNEQLNMPVLTPSDRPPQLVAPKHDCCGLRCTAVEHKAVIQEHCVTVRKRLHVMHKETAHYLLNMHTLHNANLIRETLPSTLTKPVYYAAETIRVTGTVQRARAAAKAAETRACNKEARAQAAHREVPGAEQHRDRVSSGQQSLSS
ncbi:hypothetical protein C8Q72DRAFT_875862 [Fomitopsis betulina]|nr:hypothetical protein C8Q72DRAFT_875862 [Fomitopsis betulina]